MHILATNQQQKNILTGTRQRFEVFFVEISDETESGFHEFNM